MEVELLSPGMEYLYDARDSAEEFLVGGQFQQGLCRTSVEEGIQEVPVGKEEDIELCRDGKDYMKIRCIDDLSLSGIYPDLFQKCLAVRTVTVAAGIMMEGHMPAVVTYTDITAKLPGLTGHEGGGSFPLYKGGRKGSSVVLPGVVKDLLDLKPVHGEHLPSCQRG